MARLDHGDRSVMPRRVLYVVNDLAVGGAQRALLTQAAALDRGRFVTRIASLELVAAGAWRDTGVASSLDVVPLRRSHEPRAAAASRLRALVRGWAPDVVHTHLAAAGVAGRVAARLAGTPCIVSTQHNLSDWEERHRHPLRALERRTLPIAHRVVAVSDAVRAAVLRRLPRIAERVVTIRNGIDLASFRTARADRARVRAELGIADQTFVVGAVARLDPAKALDTLVRAVARLERGDVIVVLAGEGPERGRLGALAAACGSADRVQFLGARCDVPRLLGGFDAFAVPSRTEGLGIAAIEALAAGLPVLASAVGGLVEVVDDGVTGRLLPAGDVAAWSDAIAGLHDDRAGRERLGAAAAAAATRFDIDATAVALDRLYTGVLAARGLAAAA